METPVALYRPTMPLVAAQLQPDGSYIVIQDGETVQLSAEAFAAKFAPATIVDLRRATPAVAVAPARAVRALPAPARRGAKPGPKSKVSPAGRAIGSRDELAAKRAQARRLWDQGRPVPEIAKAVGKTSATIYGWSSTEKWPTRSKISSKANADPRSRFCRDCGNQVIGDPCPVCKAPGR